MMLKHLRSLVVAYDHLSDDMRRDLTTALEIIKNREVLNMVSEGSPSPFQEHPKVLDMAGMYLLLYNRHYLLL